jgi:hypothetical protein
LEDAKSLIEGRESFVFFIIILKLSRHFKQIWKNEEMRKILLSVATSSSMNIGWKKMRKDLIHHSLTSC